MRLLFTKFNVAKKSTRTNSMRVYSCVIVCSVRVYLWVTGNINLKPMQIVKTISLRRTTSHLCYDSVTNINARSILFFFFVAYLQKFHSPHLPKNVYTHLIQFSIFLLKCISFVTIAVRQLTIVFFEKLSLATILSCEKTWMQFTMWNNLFFW